MVAYRASRLDAKSAHDGLARRFTRCAQPRATRCRSLHPGRRAFDFRGERGRPVRESHLVRGGLASAMGRAGHLRRQPVPQRLPRHPQLRADGQRAGATHVQELPHRRFVRGRTGNRLPALPRAPVQGQLPLPRPQVRTRPRLPRCRQRRLRRQRPEASLHVERARDSARWIRIQFVYPTRQCPPQSRRRCLHHGGFDAAVESHGESRTLPEWPQPAAGAASRTHHNQQSQRVDRPQRQTQGDMALLKSSLCRDDLSAPPARRTVWAVTMLVLLSCIWNSGLVAAPAARIVSEEEVRAVFLLHLARFVRWPEQAFKQADSPLVVGVLQSDRLAEILREAVRDENVGSRRIECRVLRSPSEIAQCHLVFVGAPAVRPVAPLIAALQHEPILLVSDAEGFLNLGGHVQFFSRSGEVKLRVAPSNLKSSHLAASSQLLRIARVD
ncbi:MAG: hypothetical protein C0518_04085 [Opitutus sp.]|nr:hypothetical protein [Opitutus sp.]